MAVSANRLELLQIADAVAREKAIDRGIVIAAMEDAIQKAARSRYGSETEVRAEINPKTGDYISEALPPLEYGRIAAQSAKQVIVQKVREAERDRQYQEYKDRIGDIVNGIVKRVEYGNVVVDLGRGEAIVRRDELPPRGAGAADLPFPDAPAVHGEIVRPGGPGDLRRHRRGQGGGPRSGLAGQDCGDLAGFLGRPGGGLRRHARLSRAGGGERAARRENRHHSVDGRSGELRRERPRARRSG